MAADALELSDFATSTGPEPLHRCRPGADRIRAASPIRPLEVAERIWLSPGLSNTYLIGSEDGTLLLNSGMGFEGPVHRDNYAGVVDGPPRYLAFTQGHYDHVGGADAVRGPETILIAHANWEAWRDDNERLAPFRTRNAAFAWTAAIDAALRYAAEQSQRDGSGFPAQSVPVPDLVVPDRHRLDLGGRSVDLIGAEGGETTDSLIAWLPEERICLAGNAFGALVGHIPNLVTLRGDRYRDALTVAATVESIRDLGAETLLTGHFGPIVGADYIATELTRVADAVRWLHDATVDAMNSGRNVWETAATLRLPDQLTVGEGYGTVRWGVRAIWETYAGWFHHRSTAELYPQAPDAAARALAARLGTEEVGRLAAQAVADDPALAVSLLESLGDQGLAHPAYRQALTALRAGSENFWESAWLERQLGRIPSEVDR